MNITLWAWGRYGLAVSALILLGVPAVAAPSAIKISQGVSQQGGGNPAAERALTEGARTVPPEDDPIFKKSDRQIGRSIKTVSRSGGQ